AVGSFTDGAANDGILLLGPAVGGNTFNVQATRSGSTTLIRGGGASDTFNVSSDAGTNLGSLTGIQGVLTVEGGSGAGIRSTRTDLGEPSSNPDFVGPPTAIPGLAPVRISDPAAGSFTDGAANDGILLYGAGVGGNVFNVRSTLAGGTTRIVGG